MEEVVEGVFKIVFRVIKWVVIDAIVETLVYWYGRLFLKIITFGQYPKKNHEAETRCILAGMVAIALTVIALIYFYPK